MLGTKSLIECNVTDVSVSPWNFDLSVIIVSFYFALSSSLCSAYLHQVLTCDPAPFLNNISGIMYGRFKVDIIVICIAQVTVIGCKKFSS